MVNQVESARLYIRDESVDLEIANWIQAEVAVATILILTNTRVSVNIIIIIMPNNRLKLG